jgi:phosphohistidine phosphatase SixA
MALNSFSRTGWLSLPLVAVWGLALAAEPVRTVIVVRHAERAGGMGADVGLSEVGQCRAEMLARMLADTGVKHIYTSEVTRTQQTAEPLAKRLTIQPEVVSAKDLDGLLRKLRTGVPGGIALVVGHSNTVPEIIGRLGGAVPPIGDNEYDRLLIVTLIGGKQTRVVTLHYPGCTP